MSQTPIIILIIAYLQRYGFYLLWVRHNISERTMGEFWGEASLGVVSYYSELSDTHGLADGERAPAARRLKYR